jgi:hypothetical protein
VRPLAAIVTTSVLLSAACSSSATSATTTLADPTAAKGFVEAWDLSRRGTWTERGTAERAGVANPIVVVQRPPDRLTRIADGVSGRLGGRLVTCVADPNEKVACHDGGAAPDYGADTDQELANLRQQLGGPTPLYYVTSSTAGCFDLRLTMLTPAPPFGDTATFCFDETTGATKSVEVTRGNVVDRQEFTEIRSGADEEALRLPAPIGG